MSTPTPPPRVNAPLPPEVWALEPVRAIEPLLRWHEKMLELGLEAPGPIVVHSSIAARAWPIFNGSLGAFPLMGMGNFFGLTLAWSQGLDLYVMQS